MQKAQLTFSTCIAKVNIAIGVINLKKYTAEAARKSINVYFHSHN